MPELFAGPFLGLLSLIPELFIVEAVCNNVIDCLFNFIVDDPKTDVEKASTKWGSSQLYHMLHFVGSSSKNK